MHFASDEQLERKKTMPMAFSDFCLHAETLVEEDRHAGYGVHPLQSLHWWNNLNVLIDSSVTEIIVGVLKT